MTVRNLKVGRTWLRVGIVQKGGENLIVTVLCQCTILHLCYCNLSTLGVSRLYMRVSSSNMTSSRNGPDLTNAN